jgi:hypothetical protein
MSRHSASDSQPILIGLLMLCGTAFIFGGGQGTLGDSFVQVLALLVLLLLCWRQPVLQHWPKPSMLVLLIVLPVLLFLCPWPEFLIQRSAARVAINAPILDDLAAQARRGSAYLLGTERAFLWLLPAVALFLAGLQMPMRHKKMLILVVIGGMFLNAIIGLAQNAQGPDSALYFYSNTNRGVAVGFFANNNHYAIALAACLPMVLACLAWLFWRRTWTSVHPLWFVLFSGVAILFMLGFMLSGSRAGLLLGMLGCALIVPAVIASDEHKGAKHGLFAVLVVGLFIAIQIGLYFISLQFAADPLADGRWKFIPVIQKAIADFAPLGSGPGSFWFVYPHYEGLQADSFIVNHAHNDYLELWLELRWLFLLPALVLLGLFFWQGFRLYFWAKEYDKEALLIARAAWIGLLLLLLHSTLDYPMRTTALSALCGLLAALIVLPTNNDARA